MRHPAKKGQAVQWVTRNPTRRPAVTLARCLHATARRRRRLVGSRPRRLLGRATWRALRPLHRPAETAAHRLPATAPPASDPMAQKSKRALKKILEPAQLRDALHPKRVRKRKHVRCGMASDLELHASGLLALLPEHLPSGRIGVCSLLQQLCLAGHAHARGPVVLSGLGVRVAATP